jgi:hypothetical protein
VFVGNNFPKFGANLVAALATLNADDFAHVVFVWFLICFLFFLLKGVCEMQ